MTKRLCDHAVTVLRRTNNDALMSGDTMLLLHQIAKAAGLPAEGPRTEHRVLSALSKTPGELIKGYTLTLGGRRVRIFRLENSDAK